LVVNGIDEIICYYGKFLLVFIIAGGQVYTFYKKNQMCRPDPSSPSPLRGEGWGEG
jgi:hypothetical protein